jgi:hypothetical protein
MAFFSAQLVQSLAFERLECRTKTKIFQAPKCRALIRVSIITGNAGQKDLIDFDLDFVMKKYVEIRRYMKNYVFLETYRDIYAAIILVLTSVIWNGQCQTKWFPPRGAAHHLLGDSRASLRHTWSARRRRQQ